MDEYARAADDFCRVVEVLAPAEFEDVRPANSPDTRSPRALSAHVVACVRRYADYVRKARGLPFEERYVLDPDALGGPHDVRPRLADGLRYTEEAVLHLDEAASAALTFPVRWGPTYDPEMLLEHAIVHLLRHRRQLERWR
jgi:hypothetical protein